MIDTAQIITAESWYCPDLGQSINLRGTQKTCAAANGCKRAAATDCPLYVHFLLKMSAWFFGLGEQRGDAESPKHRLDRLGRMPDSVTFHTTCERTPI
jgi:hypothetical protein